MKEKRQCFHFDIFVDLDKVLKNIKSSQQIKCGECNEGVHVKRGSEGKVDSRENMFSSSSAKKATWVCLECGYCACGDVDLSNGPQSHVVRHNRLTRHYLVIQCENPQLRWCFSCQSLFSFEKKEHGEEKDLLLDVVELIKERTSSTLSTTVETENSRSGSGSVTVGIEESDGYAVRGLFNLGNTCFFNSVMQNLLSLDQLREHFLKEDPSVGGPLVSSLKKLFAKTRSKPSFFKSAINPRAFFGSLCSQAPQFRGYQQHDSHELLMCLLDGLSIEESRLRQELGVSDSDDSCTHEKPTLIDSLFGGEISSTVSCLECGHSSKVYEPFLDLSLPIPSKKPSPKKQRTCSQAKRVLENGAFNKDSEVVSAEPELDHTSIVSILATPSAMALLDDKPASDVATQPDSEFECFWSDFMGQETSKKETDLVSQGNVSDTAPSTQANEVDQTLVGSREMLMPDNGGNAKQDNVPDKDDARATESNEDTAASGITAEIDVAQVCGCPDLGKSSSSANMWANEELPLMVADSQVLYMPYKDGISYDNNTVAEGKGEVSLSHVSGHHEQTQDRVDFNPFLDDPGIPCNDKTVKAGEGEASSSFVSGDHEQNIDYVDSSSFFDEPQIPEGPLFGPLSKPEVSGAGCMAASSNDKTFRAGKGEAFSSFVSSDHERSMGYSNWGRFSYKPEIFERPVFGQPFKAGFMGDCDSDPEVLDDSDSPVSVDRCLAQFTEPEILSEDNAWHCENCSKNLKLQRLREKMKTREGLGNGWVTETGASSASDESRDNSLNQSSIDLENWYEAAPLTELLNCKEEENDIDDGTQGDSDTKQAPITSSATETLILVGETISPQSANGNECENLEDETVDSEKVIVKRAATKRVLVNKAPPVLTIHLKRFSQDARGRLSKLSGHVDFQEFIDLSQYMDTRCTEEDQPVYRLAGLVEHLGTMQRGHYVAYIRGGHKEKTNNSDIKDPNSSIWYYASDSFVRRVSFEEVLRSEAYILFYERI